MSFHENQLPNSLYPPCTEPVCPLAELSHATLSYSREYNRDTPVEKLSSTATAVLVPRRSLLARLQGAGRLHAIDEVVELQAEAPVDPIQLARRKAISEVLFQHLATNCIECPFADKCERRMPLAEFAHELRSFQSS